MSKLLCLERTNLPHLSKESSEHIGVALYVPRAIHGRQDAGIDSLALGTRWVSAILSREATFATLSHSSPLPALQSEMDLVRPGWEASFSLGTYHTCHPPMIIRGRWKGKTRQEYSWRLETHDGIKIVRSKGTHTENGGWTRVCCFRTRSPCYGDRCSCLLATGIDVRVRCSRQ